MLHAGIDAGSRAIKVALLGTGRAILGSVVRDQDLDQERIIGDAMTELLQAQGMSRDDLAGVVATGYGRSRVSTARTTITEITCQAAGVRSLVPGVKTIVDIGGQDSKVIHLDNRGAVRDFAMNDRCAAGSGRFLEMAAARLQMPLGGLGEEGGVAVDPAPINSTCAVFAETEIVGLLASGAPPASIMAGIKKAIARRVAAMLGRPSDGPVVLTGGVALVEGMASALGDAMGVPVMVAPHAQVTGAVGAAILAGAN